MNFACTAVKFHGAKYFTCARVTSRSTSSQGVSAQGLISGYWAGSRVPGGSARTLHSHGGWAIPLGWAPAPQKSFKSFAFAQKVVSGKRYLQFKRWLGCHADIVSIKILCLISTLFLSSGNYSWVFHIDKLDRQKDWLWWRYQGNITPTWWEINPKQNPALWPGLKKHTLRSQEVDVFFHDELNQLLEDDPVFHLSMVDHDLPWLTNTLQDGSLLGSVILCILPKATLGGSR